MSFSERRRINCPAGEWTALITTAFVQMPAVWDVTFEADGGPVEGEYELLKSAWLFPRPAIRGALRDAMVFERGWWNTFYKLRVQPVRSVVAALR